MDCMVWVLHLIWCTDARTFLLTIAPSPRLSPLAESPVVSLPFSLDCPLNLASASFFHLIFLSFSPLFTRLLSPSFILPSLSDVSPCSFEPALLETPSVCLSSVYLCVLCLSICPLHVHSPSAYVCPLSVCPCSRFVLHMLCCTSFNQAFHFLLAHPVFIRQRASLMFFLYMRYGLRGLITVVIAGSSSGRAFSWASDVAVWMSHVSKTLSETQTARK